MARLLSERQQKAGCEQAAQGCVLMMFVMNLLFRISLVVKKK